MKNKSIAFGLLIIFFALLMTGCVITFSGIEGNGRIVKEERFVDQFDGLVLEGVGNVNIHSAGYYKAVVTTDSNLQDLISVKVKNNILYIDEKNSTGFNPTKLTIDVYLPELKSVGLRGVGNIDIYDGYTSDLEISLSGVGNIDAQDYQVQRADITLSGTGKIKVWATNSLRGSLSGVGDILYRGNPANYVRISGVGTVKKM